MGDNKYFVKSLYYYDMLVCQLAYKIFRFFDNILANYITKAYVFRITFFQLSHNLYFPILF